MGLLSNLFGGSKGPSKNKVDKRTDAAAATEAQRQIDITRKLYSRNTLLAADEFKEGPQIQLGSDQNAAERAGIGETGNLSEFAPQQQPTEVTEAQPGDPGFDYRTFDWSTYDFQNGNFLKNIGAFRLQ